MERSEFQRRPRIRVDFQPGAIELRQHRDEYDQLLADLQEHGWAVTIEPPMEQRSALDEEALREALGALAFVRDHATDAALAYLFDAIRRHLQKRRRPQWPKRTMPVYGPNDKILAEVELDEPEDQPADDATLA